MSDFFPNKNKDQRQPKEAKVLDQLQLDQIDNIVNTYFDEAKTQSIKMEIAKLGFSANRVEEEFKKIKAKARQDLINDFNETLNRNTPSR